MRRQHEPIRIPENWKGQDRSMVIQLDRILDDIYVLISRLEERVKALEEQEESE